MKKQIAVFGLVMSLVVAASAEPFFTNSPVAAFLQKGDLSGSVGAAIHSIDYHGDNATNRVAWGFVQANYVTPSLYGLRLGGGFIGVNEIWEEEEDDYVSVFTEDFDLSDLFLSYDILETSNTLLVGRTLFNENPGMKGDKHQGAQFEASGIPHVTFSAAVIDRWIHHDTTSFTADGITGWENVDDVSEKAGGQFYAVMLETLWLDQRLNFTPFADYQSDVMGVYGAQFSFTQPVNKQCRAGVDGIGAIYVNEVPESIEPDYEDVTSCLLHVFAGRDACQAGIGWFHVSDDKGDLGAGMFEAFDPLKEDDLFPDSDLNDCDLFYVDGSFALGAFSSEVAYGYGKNHALNAYSQELDLWLYYDITSHVQLGGYFIWTNYDTDLVDDYTLGGMSLAYSF